MLPVDLSSVGGGLAKLKLSGGLGGGKKAAKKARRAQWYAAQQAIKFQKEQYNQLKELNAPFLQGSQSFGLQGALAGLQGPEAQQAAYAQFEQSLSPAVQFSAQDLSNMPMGLQGALDEYSKGVASQGYNDYYNRLGIGAGMGQAAAANIGGMSSNAGAGIANTMIGMGEGLANAYLARGQMTAQNLSNLMSLGGAAASGIGAMYQPTPKTAPTSQQVQNYSYMMNTPGYSTIG
jgi:hypothetical protein